MYRISLEAGAEPFPGFRLQEIRGRGGFAEVWEATNPKGKPIALKFFKSNVTTTTIKEVKSLTAIQKLRHPNILQMEQVWSVPGYIVVAMELADGSMLELLDAYQSEFGTAIEAELLCGYLAQAAAGIDFLNARRHEYEGRTVGWQHCDIKPSNLLILGDRIKLADFGLSTPTTAMHTAYQRSGTLDFAAPEFHRSVLSERSDQYSLAVTYYYLRTGSFPFPAPPDGFRRKYSYDRPTPDLSLVTRPEAKALERALNVIPEERWENCCKLIDALRAGLQTPLSSNSSFFMQVVTTGSA